ncbi:DUF3152 domain-containing protein [Actinokineospora guangxiensis]|uniref:DUF3152 domain-containing protein n=1 Tax=Actinokineospora guangxiensis TaxID=1490288 RepID=A0ABW0EIV3_9PSEU
MSRTTQRDNDVPSPSAADEGRYRPGARRTTAEPLAAAWTPDQAPTGTRKPVKRGFLDTYGWRVYAVPVLLVITALVLVQTAGEKSPTGAPEGLNPVAGSEQTTEATTTTPGPELTERAPVDLDIPTAELPGGAAFTKKGKGTWRVLPGTGKQVGKGRLYTYTVEVEDGIPAAEYGGDQLFADLVTRTLGDPRSWTGLGEVALKRVGPEADPDFRVSLTSPDTTHRPDVCNYTIKYESSCLIYDRVVLNLSRWVRGAVAFEGDQLAYRQYVVNHEVGHVFNLPHIGCAEKGGLAPVMMQQTFGVANDYVHQLNRGLGGVPKDGKVCRPNAWPNPQAQPAG